MKHLLIDFENVQPQNLDNLPTDGIHIWLFIGVQHKMLPVSLVKSLLRFGERAHLVQLQKTGKNALDFYLSYYLGQITATDPEAQIGILSRDGGYDVLVEHILENQQAKGIVRLANIDEVQHQKITAAPPPALLENNTQPETDPKPQQSLAPYFQAALAALRRPDAFRPSRLHNLQKNLRKHILRDLFTDKTEEESVITTNAVINKLKAQNFISIDEQEAVSYHISDNDLLQKIQRYILSQRPKSYADFQAAVQKRADALCLTVSPSEIQAFARHLREQNLIRQENGKIEYAPFAEPKLQPPPKPVGSLMRPSGKRSSPHCPLPKRNAPVKSARCVTQSKPMPNAANRKPTKCCNICKTLKYCALTVQKSPISNKRPSIQASECR